MDGLRALGHVGEDTHVASLPLSKYISFVRLRSGYEFKTLDAPLMRLRETKKRHDGTSIVEQVKEEIQFDLHAEWLSYVDELTYFPLEVSNG